MSNKKPAKKTPAKKTPAKKQSAKKAAAKKPVAKKQTAKKSAAKKPVAKTETTKKVKKTQETSTTLVDVVMDAVITTPEVQHKIDDAKEIVEDVTSLIRMNDVKSAKIRKKMLAWFRKK